MNLTALVGATLMAGGLLLAVVAALTDLRDPIVMLGMAMVTWGKLSVLEYRIGRLAQESAERNARQQLAAFEAGRARAARNLAPVD